MGLKQGPMSLADIELLLIEAAKLSNHRNFVIAGSLSVLGAVMRPPLDMLISRDVDIYTKLDPGRVFIEIADSKTGITEGSKFHLKHGFYADPISPKILSLPDGWGARLIPVTLAQGVVANFIEPNDVAIAKLARSEENDIRWVRAGVKAGIIQLDVLEARVKTTHNILKGELKKIRSSIRAIAG
ncbi:MAG: hypothetical protein IPJ25_00550 [Rhodocyclaceae bacterium]|nr:hypothetical protein [Rhodocyclaceae bacterium]MBL0074615.1 hypothetical protein [Rhodocyclaceae bacterium]